ncbi:hypothetical protein ACJIZ3_025253 [Penstemon smallii]|uniref:Knottins-like domain-containing protein n=1 Tax=Penstemon smallii TaxID=265156 RepID=A0ABD3TUA2_9LAMI
MKFTGLVLFLVLVLSYELMIHTEARTCRAKSKRFRGLCVLRSQERNCKTICKKEGFIGGQCIKRRCFCSKKCDGPGGGTKPPNPPSNPPPPEEGGEEPPPEGGDGGEGVGTTSLKP